MSGEPGLPAGPAQPTGTPAWLTSVHDLVLFPEIRQTPENLWGSPRLGSAPWADLRGRQSARPKGPRAQGGARVEGRGQVRRAAGPVILSQVSPLAGQALSRDWPGPRPSRGAALPRRGSSGERFRAEFAWRPCRWTAISPRDSGTVGSYAAGALATRALGTPDT